MAQLLLLLFVLLPFVELFLLLQLGDAIGPELTLLFVVLTGFIGSAIVRRQGVGLLRRLQGDLQAGRLPADALIDGALVLVGGVLLVLPGVLTDVVGLLLVLPPTRALARLALGRWARGRVQFTAEGFRPGAAAPLRRAGPADVIDVEGVVRDPDAAGGSRPVLEAQRQDAPG